ncbi:MAG: FtsX-like permease family protein [Candidatus Dojkabacteria bacterium]|nr:MAG: FtsX-like permease family protein [Candidatus Dojkabacteria bacterium]
MNIFQAQSLGLKKIRFNKGKSLFVILPVAILFAIIVIASSEAQNIINVAHNNIFSPIQGQNEVLEITKNTMQMPGLQDLSDSESTGFTEDDIKNISAIENVEKASLISQLPISRIKTSSLFDNKKVTISALAGLDPEYAKLYTDKSFEYLEGQPIPIVLNANDFYEIYEDWQGQTEIAINFTRGGANSEASSQSPIKNRAISYSRDELIGKIITIEFGGLADLPTYTQEPSSTGFTFKLKSAETLVAEEESRKTAISKYWEYDKISKPLSYEFVVVGISEGSDKTMAYVPSSFANSLMTTYVSNEMTARNGTTMPSEEYNATYTGLVYDGVTLGSDSASQIFAGIRNQVTGQVRNQFAEVNRQIDSQNRQISRANSQNAQGGQFQAAPGQGGMQPIRIQRISGIGNLDPGAISITFPGAATSYEIPGLVFQKDRTAGGLTGEYRDFNLEEEIPLTSNKVIVKMSSVTAREQVVSALNDTGYTYQDFSMYKEFSTLESYLHLVLNIASGIFMVITALFVLINMAKFVSESKKEIGIFRAIGASKMDIRVIFILQSLLYIALSLVLGGILGGIGILALSNIMVSSSQMFITNTLGSSITLAQTISAAQFLSLNLQMVTMYSAALLAVTLFISLIPAEQAAKVSPVEAIRNS